LPHRYLAKPLCRRNQGSDLHRRPHLQGHHHSPQSIRPYLRPGNGSPAGKLGLHVGDYIAVNALPEISESGYINTRHLDNKTGVALVLGTARAIRENKVSLPVTCKLLFTIAEEVGVGISTGLQKNVAELVIIDNATTAEEQNSSEP